MSNPQNAVQGGGNLINKKSSLAAMQVFVASVNVADPAAMTDLNVSLLSIDAAGRLRTLITPASGVTFNVTPSPLVDALAARATVAGPGAGAAIVTIAAPPAGTYDIDVIVMFDVGAPVAADTNNMEFREGAAVVTTLQVLPVINQYNNPRTIRRVLDGATAISVNATAAGTAGVGYNAMLIATRIA